MYILTMHPDELLISAIERDTTAFVESLIAQGANVNQETGEGGRLLHYAIARPQIVKLLLAHGALVNVQDNEGDTPLHHAIERVSVLKLLLNAGALVNAKNRAGDTPLHCAVKRTNISGQRLKYGRSAASRNRSSIAQVITLLLARGANIHALNERGETPLHCIGSDVEAAEALLAGGASPHARDRDGNTPLHTAAKRANNPSVIHTLLNSGISINVQNKNGVTPLHMAAKYSDHAVIIETLLARGALVNVKDCTGSTPLSWLMQGERHRLHGQEKSIVALLLSNGAYVNEDAQHFLSSRWNQTDIVPPGFFQEDELFYTTLLLAGIHPHPPSPLPDYLQTKRQMIENMVQSWLSPCIPEKDREQVNWHTTTASVLQSFPRLLYFIQYLANERTAISSGYTVSSLKPFLLISGRSQDWLDQLSLLQALERKQLPVELIAAIRERLVEWAMVDTLVLEYQLDRTVANYLVFNVKENFEEYVAFYKRCYLHDWQISFLLLPEHLAVSSTLQP